MLSLRKLCAAADMIFWLLGVNVGELTFSLTYRSQA